MGSGSSARKALACPRHRRAAPAPVRKGGGTFSYAVALVELHSRGGSTVDAPKGRQASELHRGDPKLSRLRPVGVLLCERSGTGASSAELLSERGIPSARCATSKHLGASDGIRFQQPTYHQNGTGLSYWGQRCGSVR